MTTVNFLWHFHQPYYGLPDGEEFLLPWVRLHSVKSYYDMGRLLEDRPEIRATFNFSGSLLRQLTEYVDDGRRDRWWRWSTTDPDRLDSAARRGMVRHFFSLDPDRQIRTRPRYDELYRRRCESGVDELAESLEPDELLDLQVLFNLSWCGFSAREDFPVVRRLEDKGRDFGVDERDELLDVHPTVMDRIVPLYRKLADRDQIEISVSPMYHPIVPLVIDTESAARATPERPRPTPCRAPEDAAAHIEQALDLAEATFGNRPAGMWPSEGSVSPEAVELFDQAGVDWIATDEAILKQSRGEHFDRDSDLFRPWSLDETGPRILFRDRPLSDRIGFVYADNPAGDAADDFVDHLRDIHEGHDGDDGCISVILDGENPWEHYEDDGRSFLTALYDRLKKADGLTTGVFSETADWEAGRLDRLHSGSWIDGNYRIWIGHDETNTAWEWLRRATQRLREADPDHPGAESAREHLQIAQGSDWFWWYGDDFSSEQQDQFDALFRALVARVWTRLDDDAPPQLNRPIHRTDTPEGGREAVHIAPRRFLSPTIDGRHQRFYDWIGAGEIALTGTHGSMYEDLRPLDAIRYGFSPDSLFLRLEPGEDFTADCHFLVRLETDDHHLELTVGDNDDAPEEPSDSNRTVTAYRQVAELSVPLTELDLDAGDEVHLIASVLRNQIQLQRFPARDRFAITVPEVDPGRKHWMV